MVGLIFQNLNGNHAEYNKALRTKLNPAWWSNEGHSHAAAWLDAGWRVDEVKFGEYVRFIKAVV
ncbi:MAG: hypothetical protein CVU89_16565 [Firmicutes bacterium HGW-Firmicutes-14]|nr:MAG: hypothetical protein CVU89_16565 [Firmicutes bacterium HGW-Firmicutes-14]